MKQQALAASTLSNLKLSQLYASVCVRVGVCEGVCVHGVFKYRTADAKTLLL